MLLLNPLAPQKTLIQKEMFVKAVLFLHTTEEVSTVEVKVLT